jgi:ribosomal protein S18 acetylase RimI-like enzyme
LTVARESSTIRGMLIRPALPADTDGIWQILEPTIVLGEALPLPPDMSRKAALDYWQSPDHEVFVVEQVEAMVGSYFLAPNQAGGGDHVATATFVVSPPATGRGIAQAMCEHALARAKERGFLAMQFNFVVTSNERPVKLWQRAGFQIVGRLPQAFRHPSLGLVDVLVMHRTL